MELAYLKKVVLLTKWYSIKGPRESKKAIKRVSNQGDKLCV